MVAVGSIGEHKESLGRTVKLFITEVFTIQRSSHDPCANLV